MTKQEAYDKIVAYFSMPTAQFGWGEDQCVYLDMESRARCAVGVLIPEKEAFDELAAMSMGSVGDLKETLLYHRGETNTSLPHLRRAAARLYDILNFDDSDFIGFLEGCQRIHDRHGEAYSTQYVSPYSRDYGAADSYDAQFRPVINQGLAEAKRVMLAELKAYAEEQG